jgi:hypothetical protein
MFPFGLQPPPKPTSLIQEQGNTLTFDPSREFDVGLINGHRKASHWIEGPTCMCHGAIFTRVPTPPTFASDQSPPPESRCQMAARPSRSAYRVPFGPTSACLAPIFHAQAAPRMLSLVTSVTKCYRPWKAIKGTPSTHSRHTILERRVIVLSVPFFRVERKREWSEVLGDSQA